MDFVNEQHRTVFVDTKLVFVSTRMNLRRGLPLDREEEFNRLYCYRIPHLFGYNFLVKNLLGRNWSIVFV